MESHELEPPVRRRPPRIAATDPSPDAAWPEHAMAIIAQAEHEAEQLRMVTEQRADERIAEADRAAAMRIDAAETEAREIQEAVRIEAERTRAAAASEGEEAVRLAAARARDLEAAVKRETDRMRAEAEAYSNEVRTKAAEDAGRITRDARTAAREVLAQGTELSRQLDQLSGSLHSNSERLLRDVRNTHARLTAALGDARVVNLDSAGRRRGGAAAARHRASRPGDDDLDVPEFIPGG